MKFQISWVLGASEQFVAIAMASRGDRDGFSAEA